MKDITIFGDEKKMKKEFNLVEDMGKGLVNKEDLAQKKGDVSNVEENRVQEELHGGKPTK